ncbi:MAG: DUF2809 domain-containing protein [Eubacteriales bacterium]
MNIMRSRLRYFISISITILLGLSSRQFDYLLPRFVREYSGDILWALMIFLLCGFIFRNISTNKAVISSLIFCFLIEASQLYQASWINAIRNTTLGGLVLGYGFLWSDLICYSIGVIIGVVLEKTLLIKYRI